MNLGCVKKEGIDYRGKQKIQTADSNKNRQSPLSLPECKAHIRCSLENWRLWQVPIPFPHPPVPLRPPSYSSSSSSSLLRNPKMKKKLFTKNFCFRIAPNTKSYGASYSRHSRKENFPIARNTHSLNCNEQILGCRNTLSLNCYEQNLGCRNTPSLNCHEQKLGCRNTHSLNCQ